MAGYYRVNYDGYNWRRIVAYLYFDNYKNIPVINRAQLINDAYYFTSKGELELTYFLDIIQYLKRETDYIAWYPMFNILSYMSTYFKYSKSIPVKVSNSKYYFLLFHNLIISILLHIYFNIYEVKLNVLISHRY